MPRSRLMLKVPAASAAPVPPAQTNACARPSATAFVARTIEASRVVRAAATGSAVLAIEIGASTTSTPGAGAPRSSAGPNRSTRAPCAAAIAAPAATSAGPMSAPLQSTATTGSALLVVVLVVVVVLVARHDYFTAGVVAAHGADPVRTARAVALGAGVQARRSDAMLRPALGGAAVRLLFLGDGHAAQKGSKGPRPP